MLRLPPSKKVWRMRQVKRFLTIIDKLNDQVGKIISMLIIFMVLILVYEVVLRYIFNAPTLWAHETSEYFFGVHFFLGGAYALRHAAHVNVEVVYSRFSPRVRAILDIIGFLFFFAFCGVLLWYGTRYAWISLMRLEPCNTPFRAPLYPVKLAIPVGTLLIFLQELAHLWRNVYSAVTGNP